MSTKSFHSIMVANRGEIAVRIIRTANALGYRTIAVHSEADAAAPHVHAADDAVLLGPAPAAQSYLDVERILAAAAEAGAEAVHPGYGFLSENAEFARACEAAGLVFIGPSAESIELMGNKAAAKRLMIKAGVPCVPGYEGEDQSEAAFVKAADRIGYPVMVKAAAGGGGRGMRLVDDPRNLEAALRTARSEAENAFGCGELILEKALLRPRHVEIQVFADDHAGYIHLGERDCSVQRRHQKVIEEAPCPVMTPALRAKMGAAAVEAARSIDYRGAGTVEFLLDERGDFYFLEMNTRLQVEHPVTEAITGLDLVELQIRVARGEQLGIVQSDVSLDGHAIEVRLYAEDPAQGFLPSSGMVELWIPPHGEGIRVDSGIDTGLEISPFYDSMVAKIVAWGATRDVARRRLIDALSHTVLFGPRTNRDFLIAALSKTTFTEGNATTAFVEEELPAAELAGALPTFEQAAVGAVLQYEHECGAAFSRAVSLPEALRNWSSSGRLATPFRYRVGAEELELTVSPLGTSGRYRVSGLERELDVRVTERAADETVLVVGERKQRAVAAAAGPGRLHLALADRTLLLENSIWSGIASDDAACDGRVAAPMHGLLVEVLAAEGESVSKGDRLAVLEAMKMQHEITAPLDGVVRSVSKRAGEQIAADDVIMQIDPAES
jgi:geranyl-CoA carboxylase alpha subunit